MAVKFYNPGSRIHEQARFDHPTNDVKQQNLISYFWIEADEKSFFDVPTEVEVSTDNGPVQVSVKFADRLTKDYRQYGLIRIDPKRNSKRIPEEENVAADEASAKAKGDRMWRDYLELKAREHIQAVEQAYAMGAVPSRARGVYKHALTVLGLEDPADKVGTAINRKQDAGEIDELKKQIAELTKMVQKRN